MDKTPRFYYLYLLILNGALLLLISGHSLGQGSFKPNYYQYDASVLSTNTVYRLLEDPYGFIWMMSNKGILIFNGKTFETIKIPGNDQEIVNICRYKNTVYASSYAGQLYTIDMLTLAVKEIPLPESTTSEATPFMIMNVVDNKIHLSKAWGSFLILDPEKENQLVLMSSSDKFAGYLISGDLSLVSNESTGIWWKFWNNNIYIKSEIYELRNRKLNLFYTSGTRNKQLQVVTSYL